MPDRSVDTPPLLYRAARAAGRALLAFYFRRLEIAGREHLVTPGPAIFAANHPQSGMDAFVLGLGSGRYVHFVAQSGLFRHRLRAALLRGVGVVPVHRPHEVEGAAEKNLEAFRACREVLEAGGVIGIFPEGKTRDVPRLDRLKTGTARIALETEEVNEFRLGVRVVPVGIQFETPRRFRSWVFLRAGAPIEAAAYRARYREDPRAAVEEMTAALQEALSGLIVHLEQLDLDPLVRDIETLYREELLSRPEVGIPEGSPVSRGAILSGEIAKAVTHYHRRDPEVLVPLRADLDLYERKRAWFGVPEELLRRERLPSLGPELLRSIGALGLGLLPALYGALTCGIPYHLTRRLVAARNPDPSRLHQTRLAVGLVVYGIYFPLLIFLAIRFFDRWAAIAFAASLLPAGFFALAYGNFWEREKHLVRTAWLGRTRKTQLAELRDHRERLIRRMDVLLAEYLKERAPVPEAGPAQG